MERMSDRSSCYSIIKIFKTNFSAVITFFLLLNTQIARGEYYGKLIGKLSELHHGVSGQVYAVDSRTIFIKDFTYDGEGPAAYFFIGNSRAPIVNGIKIRDERGSLAPLKKYNKKGITLSWPDGKSMNNIRWFSIYCVDYSVNFGDVRIPRGFDYPKPQTVAPLNGVHSVGSEPVVIVDAQTLLVSAFSYDGEAPDAKFWVGRGTRPSSDGILVPDENGKITPLRRYNKKTIVLTLPGTLTIHQIGHFGVWCEAFAVDFGHIQIPQNVNVPPSLKMLGISPQSKLNCEVLEDSLAFEVRWAVAGDSIVIQLVGKLESNQYMSFGISANPKRSIMIGGDVVVAWVDKQTLQGYAVDYILDAKSQCSGNRGSCPDVRIQENSDSIRLLNAALVNGYSIVTYQRSLLASDELDLPIMRNDSQAIIWAVGPLNERNEVSFHSHYPKSGDKLIDFARPPTWNCPTPDVEDHYDTGAINDKIENFYDNKTTNSEDDKTKNGRTVAEIAPTTRRPSARPPSLPAPASTKDAWVIPPIQCNEPDDGVFYAQMGPTGGKRGYPAITGHVGWGISWYINGLLIPEINVVRGKTYTFIIEGGDTADVPARYHPFYITDDPIGGYEHKTPEERSKVKIFAGVSRQDGSKNLIPTGVGRFCFWKPDPEYDADDFSSFGAYQRTLTLSCDSSQSLPGNVQWTPDKNTPDTVYYQCYTHRYLGWKINVLDSCDASDDNAQWSSSEQHEIYVKPEHFIAPDMENSESIHVPNNKVISEQNFHNIPADHSYPSPIHHQYHYHQQHPQQQLYPPVILHHPKSHYDKPYTQYMQPPKSNSQVQLTGAYLRDPYKSHMLSSASTIRQQQQLQQQQQQWHYNNNNHNNKLNMNYVQHHHPHAYYHRRATVPSVHYPPHHHYHHYNNQQRRLQSSASPSGPTENIGEMSLAASTINIPSVNANSQSNFITDSRPFINIASMKYPKQQQLKQREQQYLYAMKGGQLMQPHPHMRLMKKSMLTSIVIPPPSKNDKGIIHRAMKPQEVSSKILNEMSFSRDSLNDRAIKSANNDVKAARNTGFNPSSIVIEGGFKPIIRQYENYNNFTQNLSNEMNFDVMMKPRFDDDMEMVANNLDIKRSPPSTSFNIFIQNDNADVDQQIIGNIDDKHSNNDNYDNINRNKNNNNGDDGITKMVNARRSTDFATSITFNDKKSKDWHNFVGAITTTTRRSNSEEENDNDTSYRIKHDKLPLDVPFDGEPQSRNSKSELSTQFPNNIAHIFQLNPQHSRTRRSTPSSPSPSSTSLSSTSHHDNNGNMNISASQMLLANLHYLILTVIFYFAI